MTCIGESNMLIELSEKEIALIVVTILVALPRIENQEHLLELKDLVDKFNENMDAIRRM